jgi:hypothetical protein
MHTSFARHASGCIALVTLISVAPAVAFADARVTSLDGHDWPDVVAGLESDTGSQGRAVALCVRDDVTFTCLPCGSYTLAFDENGARAFDVGACDARTGASGVTLVDRSALFDHTHAVPRPRSITVRAVIVSSFETSGGAASTGGSALGCTARVRPFLHDLEHGTNVYLTPDQYDVRVLRAGIDVSAIGNGWMLASETRIGADVDYDVIERSSGERVMSGHASLECESETLTTIDDPASVRGPSGTYAPDGVLTIRDAITGVISDLTGHAGGPRTGSELGNHCVGYFGDHAQQVVDLHAVVAGVRIHADGGGDDLTLAVRTSDGQWFCNDDGGEAPHALDPIVSVSTPSLGPVEIWVGAYGGGREIAYRLDVSEVDGTVGTIHARGAATRRSRRPDGPVLATGIVTQVLSWAFMAGFAALPDMLCERDGCPNATWRSVAWIPLVGPWIAESLDGAQGSSFSAPAIVDGVLQDVGLLFVIVGVLMSHEREVPVVALGDGPAAPRLALGGGGGTMLGATLTF